MEALRLKLNKATYKAKKTGICLATGSDTMRGRESWKGERGSE